MDRAALKERLRGAVRPLVDRLVDQVVEMLAKQAETSWTAASAAVVAMLREQLEGTHAEEHHARPKHRRVHRAKRARRGRPDGRAPLAVSSAVARGSDRRRAEEVAREVETPPAPAPAAVKEPRKCRLCREVGHRADRCPNATATVPVVERDIKPANIASPPQKLDRFARIEAAARARSGASQ